MHHRDPVLFSRARLDEYLESHARSAVAHVEKMSSAQLAANDDGRVVEHLVSRFCAHPLVLHVDDARAVDHHTKVDVRGRFDYACEDSPEPVLTDALKVTIIIPFSGDSKLFEKAPNRGTFDPPRGTIKANGDGDSGSLVLAFEDIGMPSSEKFVAARDETLEKIRTYLSWQQAQIDAFNSQLSTDISEAVAKRRRQLGHAAAVMKSLDIPLATKPGAPELPKIPIRRRTVRSLAKPASDLGGHQLADETYDSILKIIRHEGATFESARTTFHRLEEPELRDVILAHLNGHFEGQAKGEVFRGTGKTDILIEEENRAAFVAECKVWSGASGAQGAVDQLLGYLTWRDCKSALVLFNKDNARFSSLQAGIPSALTSHPRFHSAVPGAPDGEWRVRFKSAHDDERLVSIHVFLFDVFVHKSR